MAPDPLGKKRAYVDEDASGSFLDLPDPVYQGRSAQQSADAVDRRLAEATERPLPTLPAPTPR